MCENEDHEWRLISGETGAVWGRQCRKCNILQTPIVNEDSELEGWE